MRCRCVAGRRGKSCGACKKNTRWLGGCCWWSALPTLVQPICADAVVAALVADVAELEARDPRDLRVGHPAEEGLDLRHWIDDLGVLVLDIDTSERGPQRAIVENGAVVDRRNLLAQLVGREPFVSGQLRQRLHVAIERDLNIATPAHTELGRKARLAVGALRREVRRVLSEPFEHFDAVHPAVAGRTLRVGAVLFALEGVDEFEAHRKGVLEPLLMRNPLADAVRQAQG